MPYLYGIDFSYIIIVLPVIIASMIIQARLNSTYKKFSKIGNARRITGAQAAQLVLNYYGIYNVAIGNVVW